MIAAGTKSDLLVWMDLEMTGLDPQSDTIIEIATVLTDSNLNIIEEGPDLVIHEDASRFARMDAWNQEHHVKSGLWQRVLESKIDLAQAENATLAFIRRHLGPKESPLCGNSIWQDRRFLARYMPNLDNYLHYRLVDVSSIKELVSRWYPEDARFQKKKGMHRAMDDIKESIDELRHYQQTIFKPVIPK